MWLSVSAVYYTFTMRHCSKKTVLSKLKSSMPEMPTYGAGLQ